MEFITSSHIESELRSKVGLVLLKPDTIELGIEEFLIHHIQTILLDEAELRGVYTVKVKPENLKGIYSAAKMYTSPAVINYITDGPSILLTFIGRGKSDLWDRLKQLKGKKLINRTDEELKGSVGWRDGIRNAVPLPSTNKEYKPVFEKIQKYHLEASNYFTDEEFGVFVKNLVHTPDNLTEFYSLLKLLKVKERSEEFTQSSWNRIKNAL